MAEQGKNRRSQVDETAFRTADNANSMHDLDSNLDDCDSRTVQESSVSQQQSDAEEATVIEPTHWGQGKLGEPEDSGSGKDDTVIEADASVSEETQLNSTLPSSEAGRGDADANDPTTLIETEQLTDPTVLETDNPQEAGESLPPTRMEATQIAGDARTKVDARHVGTSQTTQESDRGHASPKPSATSAASQRYQLLERIAQGGLGNIWLAHDATICREVAYKELRSHATSIDSNLRERFLEEAQITGQLEHPCIVPIYDLGFEENGAPFYAMKLVRGETLNDAIKAFHALPRNSTQRRITLTKLLRHFLDVCNAVAFAHDHGVLHRDLKPANVMIGAFGETLVLDWGLAKLIGGKEGPAAGDLADFGRKEVSGEFDEVAATIDYSEPLEPATVPSDAVRSDVPKTQTSTSLSRTSASATEDHTKKTAEKMRSSRTVITNMRSGGSRTIIGSVVGTPAYMPPEQAMGRIDELSPRSDIYALGAILYRILTNRRPIPKGKVTEVLRMVVEGAVTPPRQYDPTIPKPLEAICLKAMAREQADRFSSALELAADVEAWLADEPVSCYRDPWSERLRRWARQHRTLVISGTAVAAVVAAGWIAWARYESYRVDQIRRSAKAKTSEARTAANANEYDEAKRLLTEALGFVEHEETLAPIRNGIRNQIDDVERLRVRTLQTNAEKELEVANLAFHVEQDFEHARVLLTAVLAEIQDESELAATRRSAKKLMDDIDAAIEHRDAEIAVQKEFQEFQRNVDQARMHGSLYTGVTVEEDSREAQKFALAALQQYRLEEPATRRPQAPNPEPPNASPRHVGASQQRKKQSVWEHIPEYLSDEQVATIRDSAFELMLIIAQTERVLANQQDPNQQRADLEEAFTWIQKAKHIRTSSALFLLEAEFLDELGQSKKAHIARETAEKADISTALDFFLMGEFERKREDYQKALEWYQKALAQNPNHFWALNFMGLCQLKLAKPDAAVASYSASISWRPDFSWPYVTRAIAYAEIKQYDNAHQDFEKAIALQPDLYFIYLDRGAVYVIEKEYAKAVADFEHASQMRPDLAAPHINLGETYRRQADEVRMGKGLAQSVPLFEKALNELTTAANLTPNVAKIYKLRGDIHVRLESTDAALRDFVRANQLEHFVSETADNYKQIGLIHHRAGNWSAALTAYDKSLDASDADEEVFRLRGEVLLALNREDEAIEAFSKFIEMAPPVGDVYRARALAQAKRGRYRDAVNDYTRALELEPSPHLLTRRGWAYLLKADNLALQDFDDAIALNPDNPDSYTGRAYAKVMLGDYQGAIADAEQSMQRVQPQIAQQGAQTWPLVYNNSTVYAQAVRQVREDVHLPDAKRVELEQQFVAEAVQLIDQAARIAGQSLRTQLIQSVRQDSALNPIRATSAFQAALKRWSP